MTDDSRRHWHGDIGNRHEHQNAWVRGGIMQNILRPVWAPNEPEKDRRGSDSSTMSAVSSASAANESSNSPPSVADKRRRSSVHGSGPLFQNLSNQKRNSTDADAASRRASFMEQSEKGGMLSKWWEGYTRGH
ncbi:hypothetical protein ASPZODRAFT_144618 [Penicilliopsis zonata CBS 506.65]|uniref:Conidiation-specific protein 8 n=1 Tax=Penicilliopsis zonata CBS 506.65 TaxID=1073090 RepID=A0A1L9SC34_9EURO|nr:hypothetical protein ASPZODRAFT_144618 [Penicilliopsis zonata CBS 506.65]OJJ44657.1 hypothetical protein ASPZODRAFT_144618 [Penicilliopsis zonata CBS 506.65]